MSTINVTAPAAVASSAGAVRGASACAIFGTAAAESAAAAASDMVSAGDAKDAVIASSDDSDSTTNVVDGLGRDKKGSVHRLRLARGRNAMAAKAREEAARINITRAVIDLTGSDMAAESSVTAPAARDGSHSRGVGDIVRTFGAVSAGTGCTVDKVFGDVEEEE